MTSPPPVGAGHPHLGRLGTEQVQGTARGGGGDAAFVELVEGRRGLGERPPVAVLLVGFEPVSVRLLEQPQRRREQQQPPGVDLQQRDHQETDGDVTDEHQQLAPEGGDQRGADRRAVPQPDQDPTQHRADQQIRHRTRHQGECGADSRWGEQGAADRGGDRRGQCGGRRQRGGDPDDLHGGATVPQQRHGPPGATGPEQDGGGQPAGGNQVEADDQRRLAPGDAHHPARGPEPDPSQLGHSEGDHCDTEPGRGGQRVVVGQTGGQGQAEYGCRRRRHQDRGREQEHAERGSAQAEPVVHITGPVGGHRSPPSAGRRRTRRVATVVTGIGFPLPRTARGTSGPPGGRLSQTGWSQQGATIRFGVNHE